MSDKDIKIVFMGTPEFAVPILKKLTEAFNVVAAVTQPDKPAGRDMTLQSPAVKIFAQKAGIQVFQPDKLKDNIVFFDVLKKLAPDVIVVAAYGKILPKEIVNLAPHGCLNVHPSLLPMYRGASPIQAALLNGDKETGVSIILLDLGLDTGDILAQEKIQIKPEDNAGTMHDKLSALGAELLIKVIPEYLNDNVILKVQDETSATCCWTINKEEGKTAWINSAQMIHNRIRAFTPWPGAYCFWEGKRLMILSASVAKEDVDDYPVGRVFRRNGSIFVKTGRDYLELKDVQLEGKNKMSAADFVNGHKNFLNAILS
jgi:methionyl-tRNA formyltransferase